MIAVFGKGAPSDEALARRMLAAAPHRGDCVTVRTLGNCALGIARRPDFVDASLSSDGSMIAALSGRIDNARELHRELVVRGVPPRSTTDADVTVAAFRAYGMDAPNRMRGAFAGIVSDGRSIWCFRDHIGFRPLFYHDGPRSFVAAAEPRQVVVGAGLVEEPDTDVLEEMFFGRMPSDAPASLKGVARLAQGNTLAVNEGSGVMTRRYWHPASLLETARMGATDVQDRFLELLDQAATRSLTGRDAVLLSGGLDSPAVAAFAAREYPRRHGRALGAVSFVFPHLPSVDERPLIETVASRFGMTLHTHQPRARALDDVDEWCRRFGSPVPILSIPEVADAYGLARRLGYENLLTGDFAEFSFGTPTHIVPHLLMRGRWPALARLLVRERRRGVRARRLAGDLLSTFVPGRVANAYLRWRRLDAPERIPAWLDSRWVSPYRGDLLPPSRDRWKLMQLAGTEGATISMEAESICGVFMGVTVRRPLADIDLWEFFLSLPAEIKCPDLRFKTLPRKLLRGTVPDEIIDRRRKTLFDEHVMSQVDYPALRRLLVRPRHRVAWVDYDRLAQRIERQDFNRFDWFWAKELAWIHAFLNAW